MQINLIKLTLDASAAKKNSVLWIYFRFFCKIYIYTKRKKDIGMGPMGKMMPTYRATNALLTISGCGAVLTVFCLPEVGRCR